MFKLLQKFGILNRFLQVIKKLYRNFKIQIKIEKCKNLIDYTTVVKQGDNLAPILFIIYMKCLAELLENKWRENDIKMIPFHHNSNLCRKEGKLISHKMKDKFFY